MELGPSLFGHLLFGCQGWKWGPGKAMRGSCAAVVAVHCNNNMEISSLDLY